MSKENNFQLLNLLDSILSTTTSKESFYTTLSIVLDETVKAMQKLPKEFRNVLILNLDVKNINNIYPILKFFKGFILITKLGSLKEENIKKWIIDTYNFKTLGELEFEFNFGENSKKKNNNSKDSALGTLEKYLENLLNINVYPSIIINFITLEDIDLLCWAYSRTLKTRVFKKGYGKYFKNVQYLVPFYMFILFNIDREAPNIFLSYLVNLLRKLEKVDQSKDEDLIENLKEVFKELDKAKEKLGEKYDYLKFLITIHLPLAAHNILKKEKLKKMVSEVYSIDENKIEEHLLNEFKKLIKAAFPNIKYPEKFRKY